MKLQVFKEYIEERVVVLSATLKFTLQKESAYVLSNWASLLSTTVYTLAMLLFIHIIYGNVKTIAGYTKNDMLIFFLIGQLAYYLTASISFDPMREMILAVNRGDLDLILTKPIPSLFYVIVREVKLLSALRDGIPPTLAILIAINWHEFHPTPLALAIGIIVFICGLICMHVFQFLASVPVFWLGESSKILHLAFDIYSGGGSLIPLEGMIGSLRFILSSILPVMIVTAFTSSVILHKSDPFLLLLWSLVVACISLVVMNVVWSEALRHYTSASS
jgi:ABC-2 type transport system permease protein